MSRNLTEPMSLKLPKWHEPNLSNVTVGNRRLSIEEVAKVARCGTRVRLNDENDIAERVQASCDYITNAIESESRFTELQLALVGWPIQRSRRKKPRVYKII